VYAAFNRLADHFSITKSDYRTAIFFFEKCLDIAILTTDMRAEMGANHSLGCVYQKMKNIKPVSCIEQKPYELDEPTRIEYEKKLTNQRESEKPRPLDTTENSKRRGPEVCKRPTSDDYI
jgi:hypothetical protein